jgi:hypothetical protein
VRLDGSNADLLGQVDDVFDESLVLAARTAVMYEGKL